MKKKIIFFLILITMTSLIIYAENFLIYKVNKGDNLSIISKRYNIKLDQLIEINNIKNPDLIYPGQELRILSEEITYSVKRGDSLWNIAKKFKVKLKTLINLNQIIEPDNIQIGQKLSIPVSLNRDRYQLASRSKRVNFIWPVQGRLSSLYGYRIHPISKTREFHKGIDIAVSMGSPIYASAEGLVIFSGQSKGYGNLIILQHKDNYLSYYAHNLALLVKKGDMVEQGKVIALSGNSGVSTGPHLHFEIRKNGQTYNPMNLLNKKYFQNGFKV